MTPPTPNPSTSGSLLTVKVVPGSSRTRIAGFLDGMVKITIAAPPEKGRANDSLIQFLADVLGCKKRDIQLISGHSQPIKRLQVSGLSMETIHHRMGLSNDM